MHVCAPQYRQCPQRPEGGVYLPELELQGSGGEDELTSAVAVPSLEHSTPSPPPYPPALTSSLPPHPRCSLSLLVAALYRFPMQS